MALVVQLSFSVPANCGGTLQELDDGIIMAIPDLEYGDGKYDTS
jgi:hypothetical protein